MAARPIVMTVNAGSSSLRVALFEGDGLAPLATHHGEGLSAAGLDIAAWARSRGVANPDAVVHRVVHGGIDFVYPSEIDPRVEAAIARLASLAPLHNPVALHWIRTVRDAWGPQVLQVAVFDTAFYANLPAAAARYALPDPGAGEPLRRYGFHGIAHEAMLTAWRERNPSAGSSARTISLQLGAGCSITAALGGAPVETSMGFTPLEGLVMATRSGDVDPGVLLYLLRERGMAVADLDRLLNHESGLKGVSGLSGDMRELLTSDTPAAKLAVDVYCHRIRKYLGAYLAVLGGADAILFGGGVGEHSAAIRERVLAGLGFAGIHLDRDRNRDARDGDAPLHAQDSAVAIWVMAVDEARFLARAGLRILASRSAEPKRLG